MSTSNDKPTPSVKYGGQPSAFALRAMTSLQSAVDKAVDRKRRLGQYWVVWDGEKPVEIHPDDTKTAAE